jgi:hypothetical protein
MVGHGPHYSIEKVVAIGAVRCKTDIKREKGTIVRDDILDRSDQDVIFCWSFMLTSIIC